MSFTSQVFRGFESPGGPLPVYVWGDGGLRFDNAGRSMQLTVTQQRAGDVAVTMEVVALPAEVDTITTHSPTLPTRCGIGPDTAAALLIVAGDNPDRPGSEASFATLCGVSPLQASSGKTTRHRPNRGGDRQANAALYRIAMSRLRWDARTRDYLHRRITEGKTHREAIRCLKRYIAREIYQIITSPPAEPQPSAA